MEIPIQVVAKIFPSPPAERKPLQHQQQQIQKDNNGNVTSDESNATAVTDNGNEENCFVQAISFIQQTGGYLNKLQNASFDSCITGGIIQAGQQTFPVTYALSSKCSQSQLYHQTVSPLISLFLEGFDASIVTYGQRGMGKTYTLYGPGIDFLYNEAEQGIIQRCVKEIFTHIANHPERTYVVNIGWVEICNNEIQDLLGIGNVQCNKIGDVFQWLQTGLSARDRMALENDRPVGNAHTLFTLTLEQQWISKEGLIQHRLSTASFSDLCSSDRVLLMNPLEKTARSVPKDVSLLALEQVVQILTDPALLYNLNGNVPYNDTALTTLLKDSFGGRAQTLFILCISPYERDADETVANLQFAFKVQCVRNFVIMNTYSDDNTPVNRPNDLAAAAAEPNANIQPNVGNHNDNFGLKFAANQWLKLVSNAEVLFSKLASNNAISELDKEQIEEWLFLKQECEECLSSNEALRSQKQLGPIQEAEEPDETVSEPETSCQQNSDNSDSESQRPDLDEKLELLMDDLRIKTDSIVKDKYKSFIKNQPKAVMKSQDSLLQHNADAGDEDVSLAKVEERKASVGGRRRSIQPGSSLSSAEIAMLNRVASREQAAAAAATSAKGPDDSFVEDTCELMPPSPSPLLMNRNNAPVENIQRKLRKLEADIEARQLQIKEIEQTMQLKQNIIADLIKNSETRSHAKQRFHKKKAKLEAEVEKAKKVMAKAIIQGKDKNEVDRLRGSLEHLEERLQDLISIKHIAGESAQKVKKLQQSLHESKKVMDDLQKKVKKEKKLREQLESELKELKDANATNANVKALVRHEAESAAGDGKQLEEMKARISHLDHVLREKSANLVVCEVDGEGQTKEEKESLRHEIRNLRRTRDHLLDQRCCLDRKLKKEKTLSQREERKLLECDEAIEAIDAAIEFKNELICGHKSIDTSERLQREKGEQMLMARLNKLSAEEMRTLLYKYFVKVIDLRDSSRKLEVQLMQLERERDVWEWKERVLSNAVRQARLEGERNAVLLQRQHEMKLTLMLRHLAEETSMSSSGYSDHHRHHQQRHQQHQPNTYRQGNAVAQQLQQLHPNYLASLPAHLQAAVGGFPSTTSASATTSATSESDFDLEFYKNSLQSANAAAIAATSHKMLKPPKHSEMEICPSLPDALTKYKPLDKLKEKERETKNKLFAKFQVLTRYTGQSPFQQQQQQQQQQHPQNHSVANGNHCMGNEDNATARGGMSLADGFLATMTNKKKDKAQKGEAPAAAIPPENLKRLVSVPPSTKVTRQKNKIIIQDASRKN